MALTAGSQVTYTDINALKTTVQNERASARRGMNTTTYPISNFAQGGLCDKTAINRLINILNAINSTTTGFSTVSAGSALKAINKLKTAADTFAAKPKAGTDSGCKSGCLGLCQGCNTSCSGGCKTDCGSECEGNGCSSHCSGGCGAIFIVDVFDLKENR